MALISGRLHRFKGVLSRRCRMQAGPFPRAIIEGRGLMARVKNRRCHMASHFSRSVLTEGCCTEAGLYSPEGER